MSITLSRRHLIQSLAAVALTSLLPMRFSYASTPGDARFVFVILRGAMDGLAAFPPYGDAAYVSTRKKLAFATPGSNDGALDLDGFFGINPALSAIKPLYDAKQMAVVHAIATPYRSRSHFDGQDMLELGGTSIAGMHSGWMNRTLAALGTNTSGLAVSPEMPLALQGEYANISSWFAKRFESDPDGAFIQSMLGLYEHDALLKPYLEQAIMAEKTASTAMSEEDRKSGRNATASDQFTNVAKACANFLKQPDGPRIAMLECAGWDTHANQGTTNGQLANRLRNLGDGLAQLPTEMGDDVWKKTVVVVATEFGRTAAENGTQGSDHGTASAAMILGGNVQGGKVITEWPGLAPHQLYEGRDLKPALDMRSLLKTVLNQHLGISDAALTKNVFPDSANAGMLTGLF